jgi:hypothetical protein
MLIVQVATPASALSLARTLEFFATALAAIVNHK